MIVYAIPIISQLEAVMRSVLHWFHYNLGLTWAWSIVAVTVAVRMLLVPVTIKQIHAMQRMQQLAPQMKEIQKKFKGDKPKQNEELMKFYRENNVNPAASCLPMLLQLPVFISLYYTLKHYDFPPGSDLSWLNFIHNISAGTTTQWGGYILLVVYVASQMASGWFMSPATQQSQRILFVVMPLFFVFIIARFPAGLVIYWVTTNLWTVGQGLITRRLISRTPAPTIAVERRSSRTPPKEPPQDEGSGENGAGSEEAPSPTPAPSATQQQPRQVRRKKKRTSRR